MRKRFWFVIKNAQGICFPWKCDASDERSAYRQLWEEHKEDLSTAEQVTEEGAKFTPYRLPNAETAQNPSC